MTRLWAFAAAHPGLYRFGTRLAMWAIRLFAKDGWIGKLPLADGWTRHRDFPKPAARSFFEEYQAQKRRPDA